MGDYMEPESTDIPLANSDEELFKLLISLNKTVYGDSETTADEEIDETICAKFNTHEKLPSSISSDLEYLRVWSNIRFKSKEPLQRVPKTLENITEVQEKNHCIPELNICTKNSKTDERKIVQKFMEEEMKSDVLISKWNSNDNTADLPIIEDGKKKFFRFYYLDAFGGYYEEESTAFLFGKTFCPTLKCYKSCCIVLYPLKRRLFVVPRHNIANEFPDNIQILVKNMLNEFYKLALKPLNIIDFNYRFVRKKLLPGLFMSTEQMLLEIEYSACFPVVDRKLEGKTFSKIFNENVSCLENFLLEKNIRGPCWLEVLCWKKTKKARTWCAFELTCLPQQITLCESFSEFTSPPLTLISFDMKILNEKIAIITWAANFNYEIWKENCSVIEGSSLCAFYYVDNENQIHIPHLENLRRTKIETARSEEEILKRFLKEFHEIDPDIIVIYDSHNKSWDKFIDRLDSLNIKERNEMSRFRIDSSKINAKNILNGRLLCDLRHLIKEYSITKNHELDYLYENFLSIKKNDISEDMNNSLLNDEEFLEIFVILTNNSLNLLKLVSKISVIPLTFMLTEICGNILNQTFRGGITKRSEYLLSHALHQQNFILPSRPLRNKSEKKELPLIGGLVLEPLIGMHENYVLLMDFQSLYPSIINEYNLCITKTECHESTEKAVLPKLMSHLIEMRKNVKNKMKTLRENSVIYFVHQVYETALKLSANSIYGCLNSKNFRYYSPSLAKEITGKAREILQSTVDLLHSKGFRIIYGDTDSIMVDTGSKDLVMVRKIGSDIREMVNSHYVSLNLKIDAVFKKLLLVTKKKYAGIVLDEQNEETMILKGLDIVRYDLPQYVNQIGKNVIDVIFSDDDLHEKCCKIRAKLNQAKEELLKGVVPLESLIMNKYLQQDPCHLPNSYLPHAQVAQRCREKNLINFKNGDSVSFIMCTNKDKTLQKAFHPVELNNVEDWVIDGLFYYRKQIYPFVSRICSLININGLDEEEDNILEKGKKKEVFKGIEFERRDPFEFSCRKCREKILFDEDENSKTFENCPNPNCDYLILNDPVYLSNNLVVTINSYIKKYYRYKLKCTNMKCPYTTLRVPVKYENNRPSCPFCFKGMLIQEFNDTDLFLQLQYFKFIFKYGLSIFEYDKTKKDVFESLMDIIKKYEDQSSFQVVDLKKTFELF